jgi:hypothetical protein
MILGVTPQLDQDYNQSSRYEDPPPKIGHDVEPQAGVLAGLFVLPAATSGSATYPEPS